MSIRQCLACGERHDGFQSATGSGKGEPKRPRFMPVVGRDDLEPMHDREKSLRAQVKQ